FLDQQRYSHPDPVMRPWSQLRKDLRESNRSQVEYLVSILRACGFHVRTLHGIPGDPKFSPQEVEQMSEMEHGRWNVERLMAGWRYAEKKNAQEKLSPYIVSWEK